MKNLKKAKSLTTKSTGRKIHLYKIEKNKLLWRLKQFVAAGYHEPLESKIMSDNWDCLYEVGKAESLIGKYLLVGITRRNRNEEIISIEQFHGPILRINMKDGLVIKRADTKEEMSLPPQLEHYEDAAPGEYRLKSTGEVVVDPDLVASWTVYPPEEV